MRPCERKRRHSERDADVRSRKPEIAACVQVLTHRCHLPPPAIFQELPYTHFNGQTLSIDPRTIKLVQLAARQMKNVRTLRIILGHPNLTDALLRCFFDIERARPDSGYQRIRKLWLENCRISIGLNPSWSRSRNEYDLPVALDMSGIEAVRLRRLPMRPGIPFGESHAPTRFVYARTGTRIEMHDGRGGYFVTTTNESDTESYVGERHVYWLNDDSTDGLDTKEPSPLQTWLQPVLQFDDNIYEALEATGMLPREVSALSGMTWQDRALQAYRGSWLDPDHIIEESYERLYKRIQLMQRETIPSADAAFMMLRACSATLTSLNLDWVQTLPPRFEHSNDPQTCDRWTSVYTNLFRCRFPHLRALQLRNCVVPETEMPHHFYLLDRGASPHVREGRPRIMYDESTGQHIPMELAPLKFMSAHPNIQCLAWPMDRFFSPRKSPSDIEEEVNAIIDNLGRTLTELRVDMLYAGTDEAQSEEFDCPDEASRTSRRRFITHFCPRMTKLTSIKIEGGLPRDERREIIRALHNCPLTKIVMIGVSSPLGNTWGPNGIDLIDSQNELVDGMHGEDLSLIQAYTRQDPKPPPPPFQYSPIWTWDSQPPMLWTLASFHSSTIRELKFCGYKGASILFSPTPITSPLLSPLKHFHSLESLILSFWLTTTFESSPRDAQIIQYWLNSRSPSSTALVHITDEEPEGWEKELRTKFAPDALAWHVTNFLGPFLSERAKKREGGVHVRASFCLGDWGGIFDLDLWVGKGSVGRDVCLGWKGPREELEGERRREKLESRAWF